MAWGRKWHQKAREVGTDEKWRRVRRLGQGGGCTSVSLAVASRDGFLFAVKSAPRETRAEVDLHNEKALLLDLANAPNMVRCLGWDDMDVDEEGTPVCSIFLEYMPEGSVQDLIKRSSGGRLSEEETRVYTRAVSRALDYMHSHGLVHCDVKCGNVLLADQTTPSRAVKESAVRLADLGFGKRLHCHDPLLVQELQKLVELRGTLSHMAPEVLESGPDLQLPPSDIWSLGCTVVNMLQGCPPWGHGRQAMTRQSLGALPLLPSQVSADCHDFITNCLQRLPSSRWTSRQLLHHPFLAPSWTRRPSYALTISGLPSTKYNTPHLSDSTSKSSSPSAGARRPCKLLTLCSFATIASCKQRPRVDESDHSDQDG